MNDFLEQVEESDELIQKSLADSMIILTSQDITMEDNRNKIRMIKKRIKQLVIKEQQSEEDISLTPRLNT